MSFIIVNVKAGSVSELGFVKGHANAITVGKVCRSNYNGDS